MGRLSETFLSLLGEKPPGRVEIIQNESHSNEKTKNSDKKIDDSFIFLSAPDVNKKAVQGDEKSVAQLLPSPEPTLSSDKSKRDILLKKESSLKEDTINKDGLKTKELAVIDEATTASENEKLQQEVTVKKAEEDCFGCKVTSTVTCFGAGTYIASKAWNVPPQHVHKAFAFRGFVLSFASIFFLLGTAALFDVKVFDPEDFSKEKSYTDLVKSDLEKMKTLGNKIRNMDIKMNTADQSKP